MSNTDEIKASEYETLAVLSNATQAGANIVRKVAGNDVADGFDGEQLTAEELNATFTAKLNGYLMNPVGGQK
jgi:hypothetical protein